MNDPYLTAMFLFAMLAAGTLVCILAGGILHLFRRPLGKLSDRLMRD